MSRNKLLCAVAAGLLLLTVMSLKTRADDASLGAVGYGVVSLKNDHVFPVLDEDLGLAPLLLPTTGADEPIDNPGLLYLGAWAVYVLVVWIRCWSCKKNVWRWR